MELNNKSLLVFFLLIAIYSYGQNTYESENKDGKLDKAELEEINNQLDNPLSKFWSLIFQENINFNSGDLVDGTYTSNVFNFQPSLPIPVGKKNMLLVRPVFPFLSSPVFDQNGNKTSSKSGFGDMQVFSLFGPDKKDGLIWGAGLTFTFPTASSEYLGSGKFQMGPAIMLLSMGEKWVLGTIVQHWKSVSGKSYRADVNRTEIQYIIRKRIKGKAMSIGMGPSIIIDSEASEGNRVTFPIGLGVTKTVKWGNTPWKLRLEPQYSIVKPDNYGTQWSIRIQFAPIIKSPFLN